MVEFGQILNAWTGLKSCFPLSHLNVVDDNQATVLFNPHIIIQQGMFNIYGKNSAIIVAPDNVTVELSSIYLNLCQVVLYKSGVEIE